MKYQWQCLAFGVSTTGSLEGAWSIATVNLSPFGKQQLVDFQIFKGRVYVIHTTNAQHIFYKLKVWKFVDLANCQICVAVHWFFFARQRVAWPVALGDSADTSSAMVELARHEECEIWRVERRCHKDNVCQCKALGKGEEGASNPVGFGMVLPVSETNFCLFVPVAPLVDQ